MNRAVKILFKLNGEYIQYIFQLNFIKMISDKYAKDTDITVLVSENQEITNILSVNQSFATFKDRRCLGDMGDYDLVADLYWFPKVFRFKKRKIRRHNAELYTMVNGWIDHSKDIHTKAMCEPNNDFLFTITQYLTVFGRKIYSSLDVGNYFDIRDVTRYKVDHEKLTELYKDVQSEDAPIITVTVPKSDYFDTSVLSAKYNQLCGKIKGLYENIRIIQLHRLNDDKLENADIHCYDMDEIVLLPILDRAVLHIGAEDDHVHTRRALSQPVSASVYYSMDCNVWGYESNINLILNDVSSFLTNMYLPPEKRMAVKQCTGEKFEDYENQIIRYLDVKLSSITN